MLLTEIFGIPTEFVNNVTSTAMLIIALAGAVRYQTKRNDSLVDRLETSHAEREQKLMDVIKEVNSKHEECTERYFTVATKVSEPINDLKNAIDRFGDKLESIRH